MQGSVLTPVTYAGSMRIRGTSPADDLVDLIARVEQLQGAAPFGEVALSDMAAAEPRGIGLVAEEEGALRAYAYAVPNPDGTTWSLEIAVDRRDSDSYDSVLGATLEALADRGVTSLVLWVHSPIVTPGLAGMRLERELHRLVRSLPVPGAIRWPKGTEVRGFRLGEDERAWLAVNNRAFATHPEQSGWTVGDLEARLAHPWFDPDGLRMIWVDGELAAFHWTKVHPAPEGGQAVGEVFVIAVDPAFRGRGLGRAVTLEGLDHLTTSRGVSQAILYVDAANAAGIGLYTSLGFQRDQIHRAYRWTAGEQPAEQ